MSIIKGAGNILGDHGKGRDSVQKSILRHNLKEIDKKWSARKVASPKMSKKHEMAEKMRK